MQALALSCHFTSLKWCYTAPGPGVGIPTESIFTMCSPHVVVEERRTIVIKAAKRERWTSTLHRNADNAQSV